MNRLDNLLFLIIAGGFVILSSQFQGFLQDDAYIFARYAQNIADGNGFVYNKGEYTEGATSFLWTLIAAMGAKMHANIPLFLKYAGLVSSILWLFAFYLVCKQWLKKPFQWVLPVILFACFPNFAMWSQAGLEVSFFGFLVTIGFYWVEEWHKHGQQKYFVALCITSCMLILTRPEGLPVTFLYAAYLWFCSNKANKNKIYTYLPVVLSTIIALTVFRYAYFGDWVPNTYYAKGGGGYYLRRLGLGKLNDFLGTNGNLVFIAACFPSVLLRNRILFLVAMVPMWMAYYINAGGDILPEHRLLLPAVPFMFLGAFYLSGFIRNKYFAKPVFNLSYNIVVLIITISFAGKYLHYHHKHLAAYSGVISALERAHGTIGKYLDANMKNGDTAILTDAGMTALYAQDKHIVDWLGLCDKRVAKIFYESGYFEWAMYYCYNDVERKRRKEKCYAAMNQYFDELKPRYAVLNLYLRTEQHDAQQMIDYFLSKPDTLDDFVLSKISFEGYFGVFTKKNKGRNYKPKLIIPYSAYFWMVLVERT